MANNYLSIKQKIMRNILLNPADIVPEQVEYLDGKKIISTENKQLYGYYGEYADCGVIQVYEEGYYIRINSATYEKIDITIGDDCTEEFLNLPFMSGFTPDEHYYCLASSCTCSFSGTSFIYFVDFVEINTYDGREYENHRYSVIDSTGENWYNVVV